MHEGFDYRREVCRKLIHLSSLWMPLLICVAPRDVALGVFALGVVFVAAYEVLRRRPGALARLLDRLFGAMLRPDETGARFKPSGAVYVLIAAFVTTFFFARDVAAAAMAMMLMGDAAAALVGRKFGRWRVIDGKSFEGALAFFVAALVAAAAVSAILPVAASYPRASAYAALAAAVTELVARRLRVDDNLSVPLVAAAVMTLTM